MKLQEKAGKVGFDWNDPYAVLAKIHEEADEIAAASTAARRESLSRIAQTLLRGKTDFQVHAADDSVLTSSITTLEMSPAGRAALLGALSGPTTQK